MTSVRIRTPERLVRRLGYGGKVTANRQAEAFDVQRSQGYFSGLRAMQTGRRARVAFVARDDPRADLVERIHAGTNSFSTAEVEKILKAPLRSERALKSLSHVGICVVSLVNGSVELAPANVDLATMVNISRGGVGRRGWKARDVVARALDRPVGSVKRLTEGLRMAAAERLEALRVDASELLIDKRFIHLHSTWILNGNGEN